MTPEVTGGYSRRTDLEDTLMLHSQVLFCPFHLIGLCFQIECISVRDIYSHLLQMVLKSDFKRQKRLCCVRELSINPSNDEASAERAKP